MADNYLNEQGLSALRSWVLGKIAAAVKVPDTEMSDTSTNFVENRAIKSYVDARSGGSVALASMFDLSLDGTYHVESEADAPNIIATALNLDGFSAPIGTSGIRWRRPTVTIPTIAWSDEVDENYDFTATTEVRVNFGEAGSIAKTVTFKKPGPGKLYAAKLIGGGYVDSGIAGDYAYTYHMKGHAMPSNQCVLVDAFVSTAERATLRMLAASNKVQIMWPGNSEITYSASGIDVSKMFEVTLNARRIDFIQGGASYGVNISGKTSSGAISNNITLMGSTGGPFANSIFCFAEILDAGNNVLGYFAPYELLSGEVVLINTNGITAQQVYEIVEYGDSAEMASHIHRPNTGYLEAVTQAEDVAL